MAKRTIKTPNVVNSDLPGLTPDPGTFFFNAERDILQYIDNGGNIQSVTDSIVISQSIFVNSVDGDDATGKPFKTYDAARLYATSIASPTNIVVINIIGDQTISGDFVISPYIMVNGNQSGLLTISGNIVVDTAYFSLSATVTHIANCAFSATGINAVFGAGDENIIIFENCSFVNVPNLTVTSPNSNPFGNGILLTNNADVTYLPFNTSFTITDAIFGAINCFIAGLPSLIATGSVSPRLILQLSQGFGQITVDGTGATGQPTAILQGNFPTGVNLNSTNALLSTDAGSLDIGSLNFSGGATVSQVQLNTGAEPIKVSSTLYIPNNYTKTSPNFRISADSITSHLNGINTVIGNNINHTLYVNAVHGNDSWSGAIGRPFATYNAARVFAAATATPTNRFLIIIDGDQNITGDFIINPYISVDQRSSGTINATGNVVLDTVWTTVNDEITYIHNCALPIPISLSYTAGVNNYVVFSECDFRGSASVNVSSPVGMTGDTNGIAIFRNLGPFNNNFASGFSLNSASALLQNACISSSIDGLIIGDDANPTILIESTLAPGATFSWFGFSGSLSGIVRNSPMPITVSGSSNVSVSIDSVSYIGPPTLSSGATISQVSIIDSSDGVLVNNFTPVNYTVAVDPTRPDGCVTDHLQGIDNFLSTALTPNFQDVWNFGTPGAKGSFTVDNSNAFAVFNATFSAPQVNIVSLNAVNPNVNPQTTWGYDYYAANSLTNFEQFARTEANVTNPASGSETCEWRLILKNAGADVVGFYVPPNGANPKFANNTKTVAALSDFPTAINTGVGIFTQINSTGATVVYSFANKVGNTANFSAKITFNATSALPTIVLSMPFTTGFTAPGQGSGSAIVIGTPPGGANGQGTVAIIDTVSGQGFQLSMILDNTLGFPKSMDLYVSGTYQVN